MHLVVRDCRRHARPIPAQGNGGGRFLFAMPKQDANAVRRSNVQRVAANPLLSADEKCRGGAGRKSTAFRCIPGARRVRAAAGFGVTGGQLRNGGISLKTASGGIHKRG